MSALNFRQRRVLVTGASSGLGSEMARQLASREKADLILVARRRERLDELAKDLRKAHGVNVQVISADLSRADEAERVFQEATSAGDVYAAVLNAGVTFFGSHEDLSWDNYQAMLGTNVNSLVLLCNRFSRHFQKQNDKGGILLISSMAGYSPIPYQAAYSGTKAFVNSFGLALSYELKKTGVSVSIFAPGGIATEMVGKAGMDHYFKSSLTLMPVEKCARLGLQGFKRRKTFHVPGFLNRSAIVLMKILGPFLSSKIVGATFQKAIDTAPGPVVRPL